MTELIVLAELHGFISADSEKQIRSLVKKFGQCHSATVSVFAVESLFPLQAS